MKTRFLLALSAALTLLSACIPSVNPFYRDEDIRFDSHLIGVWQQKAGSDGPVTWQFEAAGTNAYKLTVTEKEGKQGTFSARLFQLKQEQFLDIVPSDCKFDPSQAELVGFAVFPGHLVVRVSQIDPTLKLAFCNFDWLAKYLEKQPKALGHYTEEKRILLTAKTRQLQRFILKHLADGELFQAPEEFVREPEDSAEKL